MSPRAKSWTGGILFAFGIFVFFAGALFPSLVVLAYVGGAAALASLFLIGSAIRAVGRQIGENQARFEALLRADAERERKKPPA